MGQPVDATVVLAGGRPVHWRGRSGQAYMLEPERFATFVLAAEGLYLLARGNLVLWVGSAADVVDDAQNRSRFRLALDCADRAFRVVTGHGTIERLATIWDLEGAGPVSGPAVVAA